jgi:hypothetical protein
MVFVGSRDGFLYAIGGDGIDESEESQLTESSPSDDSNGDSNGGSGGSTSR